MAIKILAKYGTERVMIHSAADWGRSNPLSVPLVAQEMKISGQFSDNEIDKVTFSNAIKFFKQSPKFTWNP
jgi:predicted metal-dependent TIM-barrel fold hydrolase